MSMDGEIVQGEQRVKIPTHPGKKQLEPPAEKPKTYEQAQIELLESAKRNLDTLSTMKMVSGVVSQPEVKSDSEFNKEMSGMFSTVATTLQGLVSTERDARIAAEQAQTKAQQQYFETMANWMKDIQLRAQQPPIPQSQTLAGQLQEVQAWQNVILQEATKVNQQAAAVAPAPSGVGPLDIQLRQLEMEQSRSNLQLQQAHEIAMKELDLRLKEFDFSMAKWRAGEQKKGDWFQDSLRAIATAVQSGVQEGAGGAPLGSGEAAPTSSSAEIGKTPAGLVVMECQAEGCGTRWPIVPGAQFAACPKCGAQYQITDNAPGMVPPGPVPPQPPPQTPQYPGETAEELDESEGKRKAI